MKKYIKIALSFAISILCFIFIFQIVPPELLWNKIQNTNYILITAGVIAFLTAGPINAYRWKLILDSSDFKNAPIFGLYKIIMMSFLIHNIMPARLGEISKGYFLVTNEKTNIETAITTVLLERFLDLIAILMFFIITFSFIDFSAIVNNSFPHIIETTADIINKNFAVPKETIAQIKEIDIASFIETPIYFIGILVFVIIALIIVFRKQKQNLIIITRKILFFLSEKKFSKIEAFLQNTKLFTNNYGTHLILISTIGVWICYLLSTYLFFKAFSIDIPLLFMPFIIGVAGIGISVPSAPGGLGPFELAMSTAAALSIGANWETSIATIITCTFILHLLQILAGSLIGLYFLIKENFSFFKRDVRTLPKKN